MQCLLRPVATAPVTFICLVHHSDFTHAVKPEISGFESLQVNLKTRYVLCLCALCSTMDSTVSSAYLNISDWSDGLCLLLF